MIDSDLFDCDQMTVTGKAHKENLADLKHPGQTPGAFPTVMESHKFSLTKNTITRQETPLVYIASCGARLDLSTATTTPPTLAVALNPSDSDEIPLLRDMDDLTFSSYN